MLPECQHCTTSLAFMTIPSSCHCFTFCLAICPAHLVPLTTHLIQSPRALALMQHQILHNQSTVKVHLISYTSSPKLNSLPLPTTKKSCRESTNYAYAYGLSKLILTF